jgi:hypothetical protein
MAMQRMKPLTKVWKYARAMFWAMAKEKGKSSSSQKKLPQLRKTPLVRIRHKIAPRIPPANNGGLRVIQM